MLKSKDLRIGDVLDEAQHRRRLSMAVGIGANISGLCAVTSGILADSVPITLVGTATIVTVSVWWLYSFWAIDRIRNLDLAMIELEDRKPQ